MLMLSVPHGGSSVATLNTAARFLLLPSVEVEELRKGKMKQQSIIILAIKHV